MSITGAFVIAAICLVRLPLRKAPKMISYCMWVAAGFRLVLPFSIKSALSLMPFASQPVAQSNNMSGVFQPSGAMVTTAGSFLTNTMQRNAIVPVAPWITICACIWLAGVIVMLAFGAASVIRLKQNMVGADCAVANVYEAKDIKSPFVLGFFPPTIYIPAGLTGQEKKYVIMHENTHIMRCDHITKFIAYFILCIHWFNPLAWVAFRQFSADMEMSCDESVLKNGGSEAKIIYSQSLLRMATKQRHISGSLIAFGGKGVKRRVKNILHLRKYPFPIVIAAVVFATVLSLGLSVNRLGGVTAEKQLATEANIYTQSQHRSQPGQYVELSTGEAYTYNFGRISDSELLPPGQFYQYKTANGGESTHAYVITD